MDRRPDPSRSPDDRLLRSLCGQEPFERDGSDAVPEVLQRKRAALHAPHVQPFLDWRERAADAMALAGVPAGEQLLPHVDPVSGGVHARVVVLHGGTFPCQLAVNGGSGLVSADGTDGTSVRMWRLGREAGLARSEVVAWNVVPWAAGLPLRRPLARQLLLDWLGLLVAPARVVLLGATPRQFRAPVEQALPGVDVRTAPSASQMARITAPDFEEQIVRAISEA